MTHEELAKKIVDAAMTRPTTAREWWLQERENQLDFAELHYNVSGNKSATMWHALFAWATPDIWRDPSVYTTKENT
jgi:hypothetical protein